MKRLSIAYLGLFLLVAACTDGEPDESGSGALHTNADSADRRAALDTNSDRPGPILCTPDNSSADVASACPAGMVCDPNACAPSCPACDDCNPACVPEPKPAPCCSLDDKPGENGNPFCFEGASCCGDGTWQCNEGNGQSSCDSPGKVCDKALCCEIEEMPGFNGNPFCFEGATCCGDGTWQCNEGNGQPSCDEVSDVCPITECGGFAGIPCPYGQTCVDFPLDDCDPDNGGADCGGVCIDDACGDPS